MAKFTELFKGRDKGNDSAQQFLARLNVEKIPVRVEIEGTTQRFMSKVRLRSGAVALSYPQGMEKHFADAGWVRLRMMENGGEELRLQISTARFGGSGEMATEPGQMALLCKIPGAVVEQAKRSSERVNTGMYRDVVLELSVLPSPYRILDISKSGVQVRIQKEEDRERFPLGRYLEKGKIKLGTRAQVDLLDAIPRHHKPESVGMEMVVNPEGNSRKILEVFIDSVLQKEYETGSQPAD